MDSDAKTIQAPPDPQCPCLPSCWAGSPFLGQVRPGHALDRHQAACTDSVHTMLVLLSNDHMTDNLGFGRERRQALNQDVLHNRTTFRDSFREMLASVSETTSFEDCQRILKKSAFALISLPAMAPSIRSRPDSVFLVYKRHSQTSSLTRGSRSSSVGPIFRLYCELSAN